MAGCEQMQSTQHSNPDLGRAVNLASMARFRGCFNGVYHHPTNIQQKISSMIIFFQLEACEQMASILYSSVLKIKFLQADPYQPADHARAVDQMSIADIINNVTDRRP
jgi:hypothetical protein